MGPLQSLRILDFTTLLPGPYATLMFADLGADVVRVEAPGRPDAVRFLEPQDGNSSAAHSYINRNKRSLSLDLKAPGAADLVKQLIAEYDIVIEQFRPGVMDKLGVGYDALAAVNPKLIYCSITGYGQTGPYRDRAGHDCNYLAISGVSSYTGRKSTGPIPAGVQVADVAGGSMHAVIGILAAVIDRQATGVGQAIDISMTDAAFALNAIAGAGCLVSGEPAGLESTVLNGGGYYDYYETRDGRYMSVGSLEPQFLAQLCDALGITSPEGSSLTLTGEGAAGFRHALREKFSAMSFADCRELFRLLDACVEPVLDVVEAASHEQLAAREMVVDVPVSGGSTQPQIANPIRFSEHGAAYRHAGRNPGDDNAAVLSALGKTDEEIEELKESGVLG